MEYSSCSDSNCSASSKQTNSSQMSLGVSANYSGATQNMQMLLDKISHVEQLHVEQLPLICNVCSTPRLTRQEIINTSQYLIIQVEPKLDQDQVTKLPTLIKEIPKKSITIGQKIYKFDCMIMHHGHYDSNAHYTAVVKKGKKYLSCNDRTINYDFNWPTCGFDNNQFASASLLFYKAT